MKKYYNDSGRIEPYLRSEVAIKINRFISKSKCEQCGSKDDLIIHHKKSFEFADILNEALYILNMYEKKMVTDYTIEELNILTYYVLGRHVSGWSKILCNDCHRNLHSEKDIHYSRKEFYVKNKYRKQADFYMEHCDTFIVDDFYKNFNKMYLEFLFENKFEIGKIMMGEDINDFKEEFFGTLIQNQIKTDCRDRGLKAVISVLKQYSISYIVVSKRLRKKPYRDKTCWTIKKLL